MLRSRGIEHLTLLDVAPPRFVEIAADAGFDAVGLRVSPVTGDEVSWPMSPGSPMLAETAARCRDRGIGVLDVETIRLGPAPTVAAWEPVLMTASELGARHLNVFCEDPDLGRLADNFAALAAIAAPYQVRPMVEVMAYHSVRTLAAARAVTGNTGGGLLIDALHVQRCGVSLDELARLAPEEVAYIQLCDAPLQAPAERPEIEARTARRLPGAGELPLDRLLAALPDDIPVAVEAPDVRRSTETGPAAFAVLARVSLESALRQK
jgi:sugar phosphate isomerase/epimerase